MTLISREGQLAEAEKMVMAKFGNKVAAVQSRNFFLDITDRRSTKGQALKLLAELKGIKQEEVIAFGDNYNDLDMLKYAGLGVAVANAREEVFAVADLITGANVDDGVAQVIEQYILNY